MSQRRTCKAEHQIGQAILCIAERSEVFISQPEVERQVRLKLPVILEEQPKILGPEIALRIRGPAGLGIGVNLLKNRRIVGHIPNQMHDIQRPRHAAQVVVVLFRAHVEAHTKSMIP